MNRIIRGTLNGGTPAVLVGRYIYTPHAPSVSCGDGECPGNMVAADLARTFVPLDARDAIGCYCPSDCACHNPYRVTVCGCTGLHTGRVS